MEDNKYKYQIPVLFSTKSINNFLDGFGKSLYKKEFKKGIFLGIGTECVFTTTVELIGLFNKYIGLQIIGETETSYTMFLKYSKLRSLKEQLDNLKEDTLTINENILVTPDKAFMDDVKNLTAKYLLTEYAKTLKIIIANNKKTAVDPERLQATLIKEIDENFAGLANPIWSMENGAKTYYVYTPVPDMAALCIKESSDIDVRFILITDALSIVGANTAEAFNKYWLKASNLKYKALSCLMADTAAMQAKLKSLKFMLNVLGLNEKGNKLNWFARLKFSRELKKFV